MFADSLKIVRGIVMEADEVMSGTLSEKFVVMLLFLNSES